VAAQGSYSASNDHIGFSTLSKQEMSIRAISYSSDWNSASCMKLDPGGGEVRGGDKQSARNTKSPDPLTQEMTRKVRVISNALLISLGQA
jgi:hypothetical protein